jgi:predicted nuclease with TOPRIM domain
MTQKQIDSRISDLRVFLARIPQESERILREIYLLEDKWMEIEMAKLPETSKEEDEHWEFEPPY